MKSAAFSISWISIGKERRKSSPVRVTLGVFIEMVGAVVLTHSFVGRELIATAEYLLGKMEGIVAVSLDGKSDAIKARKIISEAIQSVDEGEGVLILTDLFGGSPSNLAFSFLDQEKIEVIPGAHPPVVLPFCNNRQG